ncbi:MAG: formylglycine-generating enzyme family protein, partial [Planctomycetota bacterium]
GTTTAYSFGAGITKQQANFSSGGTVACGSLPANQWGFREMHGNVYEWCEDGYQATASSTQDAVNGNSPTGRVLRGGAWSYGAGDVRASGRSSVTPGSAGNLVGFRVARAPL